MKNTENTRVALVALLAAGAVPAYATSPVDESFESLPLDGYAHVLDNWIGGVWGSEFGTIGGQAGAILPAHGSKMLYAVSGNDVWTQTVQIVDVSAFATLIDSGSAVANFRALYNVDPALAGAQSLSGLWTFGQNDRWGNHTSVLFNTMGLDGNAGTWEHNQVSLALPVGTRWLITEVAYVNASLSGGTGYVDSAYLEVVPEPTLLASLGAGLAAIARRRLRKG